MSDSDSFINEVTEEVRRERLFGYLRRYGWIAVLAVLLLVGGAAWNEIRKSQARAAAEATGDAMLAALNENDPVARMEALTAIEAEGSAAAVTQLMAAAAQQEAGEADAAVATLEALAVNPDVPTIYADLAAFKAAMLQTDPNARVIALESLSVPGAPFRLLALEQLAYHAVAEGDDATAVAQLNAIIEDAGVSRGLRARAETLMLTLGNASDASGAGQ